MIKHVDYIWNTTSFPTWNKNNIIDTGVFAESDCEIRVAYQGAGANVDRIVGFSQESTAGDNDDFRIFYYSNGTFDWGNQRSNGVGSTLSGFIGSGVDYDITMGNGWLYNNLTSSYIYQSSTATYNHNCSIRVDVGGQKVKSLQIKNGGVVVFDAFAAFDNSSNVIGLYDTVSDMMFTNNSLNLTYGEIINTFEISPESMSFDYTGGTSSLAITTDEGWTASTNDSWITLSSTAGTGNSTITVTVNENTSFQAKLGVVTVTDGSDTLTCTISQDKNPVLVKSDNIYFEDTKVNKMYLNGSLIYQNIFDLVFDIDTTEVEMEYTGGTFSATITANRPWSLTTPEWISASTVSGSGNANVTFTVDYNYDSRRSGNITISCNGVSKAISVEQGAESNVHYISSLTFVSNACINTGIYPTLETRSELYDVYFPSGLRYKIMFGANNSDTDYNWYRIRTEVHDYELNAAFGLRSSVTVTYPIQGNFYFDKTGLIYEHTDSTTQSIILNTTRTNTINYPIYIAAVGDNNSIGYTCNIENFTVGIVKIYDNGILVGDFRPALDENDVPCYYDEVTQQYFYNQGSGTITGNE